jgi:hypothetical protein
MPDADTPYNFSAFTTLASNRTASGVSLTMPPPSGGVSNLTQNFFAPETFFLFASSTNLSSINATFPFGDYVFNVMAASSNQQVHVNLASSLVQPNAPHTTNFAAAQAVDPAQPFRLGWDAFQNGTATDYISVDIGTNFSTAVPGTAGSLSGMARSVLIPAGTLQPDTSYDASIIFYRSIVTSNSSFTTFAYVATSTRFPLLTSGGAGSAPLVLTNGAWSGSAFSFDIISSPGQTLTVESSATLLPNEWQTLLTTNSPSGRVRITDPFSMFNPYLFYRARKGGP